MQLFPLSVGHTRFALLLPTMVDGHRDAVVDVAVCTFVFADSGIVHQLVQAKFTERTKQTVGTGPGVRATRACKLPKPNVMLCFCISLMQASRPLRRGASKPSALPQLGLTVLVQGLEHEAAVARSSTEHPDRAESSWVEEYLVVDDATKAAAGPGLQSMGAAAAPAPNAHASSSPHKQLPVSNHAHTVTPEKATTSKKGNTQPAFGTTEPPVVKRVQCNACGSSMPRQRHYALLCHFHACHSVPSDVGHIEEVDCTQQTPSRAKASSTRMTRLWKWLSTPSHSAEKHKQHAAAGSQQQHQQAHMSGEHQQQADGSAAQHTEHPPGIEGMDVASSAEALLSAAQEAGTRAGAVEDEGLILARGQGQHAWGVSSSHTALLGTVASSTERLERLLTWADPWASARVFGGGLYLIICIKQLSMGE